MSSFSQIPTKVSRELVETGREIIDLLPLILADISEIQVTCLAVKREFPWISQPNCPDFWQTTTRKIEVVQWDTIRVVPIYIDSQDLSQQSLSRLSIPQWVTSTATISHTYSQHCVGSKKDLTAIMIAVGLPDLQQDQFTAWISRLGIR